MRPINHLDLFSGAGGFSLGLREAGVKIGWHGFSDIDKHANKVFKERFPDAEELGPVESIKPDKLPRIDLITFGFPCQDLSIAGKRKGFDGSRSSLFFESIKIIEAKKPQYFVFENVKGFFSSNDGKDFAIALGAVADIGYDGQWQLLDTRWFLPQSRQRIYFVGHIRGECRPKVFPIGEISKQADELQGQYTNTLKARYTAVGDGSYIIEGEQHAQEKGGLNQIGVIGKDSEATRVYDTTCAKTIKDGGGMGAKTGLYEIPEATQPEKKINKTQYGKHQQDCYYDENGIMGTISPGTHGSGPHLTQTKIGNTIRRLTPTECERLQGFPDGWTEGQSDTQRYKQMGNAVSVPVVKSVMERLFAKESNA